MKKTVLVFLTSILAATLLSGCLATAGRLSQTVGGKFSEFSDKRQAGFVKDTTGLVGGVYTAAGQTAVEISKENAAKEAKADQSKQVASKQSAKPAVKSTAAKKIVKKPVVLKEGAE